MKHPIIREDGFTLVELMIVVAIIGLLSSVAVPNFKKFQARAKITEAKLQLASLYTAEQSFFSDYTIYHYCLPYMGYDPGPEALSRYYAVGFYPGDNLINPIAYASAVNSGLNPTLCSNVRSDYQYPGATGGYSASNTYWFPAGKAIGSEIASDSDYLFYDGILFTVGDQGSSSEMRFRAAAGGVISAKFFDMWSMAPKETSLLSIDQNKVLSIVRNGY
jgi:prepilin-type N-terminal cleavage/methylation domain-containing protein